MKRNFLNIILERIKGYRHLPFACPFVVVEIVISFTLFSCSRESNYLRYALNASGNNRGELEAVLYHYRNDDPNKEKLLAAKYLISNMPAHYSYLDTAGINSYYRTALKILASNSSPEWQRDTLLTISMRDYSYLAEQRISDLCAISSEYLIYSIDNAFEQWHNNPWSSHLTFEEFRDWILPYKVVELQSFDYWRDTLAVNYSDSLRKVSIDDDKSNSIYGALEIVRNEIHTKQSEIGLRVIWEGVSGYPFRNASTWTHMTYGTCMEYVTMGVAVFRSLGLPTCIDYVPTWGHSNNGHSWFTILTDQGRETPTMNSLIVPAGLGFYPYESIPKVYRKTYTMNRERVKYLNKSYNAYPFDVCEEDVTEKYCTTSDPVVTLYEDINITDNYAYIAVLVHSIDGPDFRVLDYGDIRRNKAYFKNMGRNVLYFALGYNGSSLVPIADPFILRKDGSLEYIVSDSIDSHNIDIRRKYPESTNVVDMRRRILGGMIQCSNYADFRDAETLITIKDMYDTSELTIETNGAYRFWRYLSADDTYGSISELSFYDSNENLIIGKGIACDIADQSAISNAFDNNMLSNFETSNASGNWVGMDFGKPVNISSVRVAPRSDDNDICPGDIYELLFWDNHDRKWASVGYKRAESNYLHYDNVPIGAILWLKDCSKGKDERPFIVGSNTCIEWW